MATVWAVKTGNWSDPTVWNTGTLPGTTDDVHANTFGVTIDQNITVNALRIDAVGGAAAGGGFSCATSRTIALQTLAVGVHNVSSSALLTLTAGSATVTVAGAISGDSSGTGSEPPALLVSGGTHTLTAGSIVGGGVLNAHTVTILGGTLTVNATTISGGAGGDGIIASGGTLTVTATTITGGSGTDAYGIEVGGAAAATIRGDLRPGSSAAGAAAIYGAGVVRYSGHVYAGGMIASTGPNGYFPVRGAWSAISGEEVYIHMYDDGNFPSGNNGTARVITRYGENLPAAADVRYGTTYGASGTNVGSLRVPPPASVAAGVLTDNTTGTAALKLSDVLSGVGDQIAAATSG